MKYAVNYIDRQYLEGMILEINITILAWNFETRGFI